ncbi:MAG: LysR family transcriptional regulator [Zoogloeaceae bacterium]|nr:LysR family transcriptional regulator [Zoogloeaceae bacterium]
MDKFRLMQTFVAIVDGGSLTAAARTQNASLAAVVRGLAALEGHLGVRLLNRSTRRMALTVEGREYAERCRRVLAEVAEAEAALTDLRDEPTGKLAITAPTMFGRLHVCPVVGEFLDAFPHMRVHLLLLDRVVDLLEEGMDLAIRIGRLPDSSLVAVPMGTTGRIVCASPDYLARHGAPTEPGELPGHRCVQFVGLPGAESWSFLAEGQRISVPIAGVLTTNQLDAAVDACLRGLGCGRFLEYQVAHELAAGRLVRLLVPYELPPVPVSLVYPHSRLLSSRVRAFVSWALPRLKSRIAALPA